MRVIEGKDVLCISISHVSLLWGVGSVLSHLWITNSTKKEPWHQFSYELAICRVACGRIATKFFQTLLCLPQRIHSVENMNETTDCFHDVGWPWNKQLTVSSQGLFDTSAFWIPMSVHCSGWPRRPQRGIINPLVPAIKEFDCDWFPIIVPIGADTHSQIVVVVCGSWGIWSDCKLITSQLVSCVWRDEGVSLFRKTSDFQAAFVTTPWCESQSFVTNFLSINLSLGFIFDGHVSNAIREDIRLERSPLIHINHDSVHGHSHVPWNAQLLRFAILDCHSHTRLGVTSVPVFSAKTVPGFGGFAPCCIS